MIKYSLKLQEQREVHLEAFLAFNTYEGLLEGKPSSNLNREIFENIKILSNKVWPHQPTCILGLGYVDNCENQLLPSIVCAGKFVCYDPVGAFPSGGSSLVVIWLQEQLFPILDGANESWLKELQWSQLAIDFDW